MKTRLLKTSLLMFAILAFFSFNSCASSALMEEELDNLVPHSDQSLFNVLSRQDLVELNLETEIDSLLLMRKTDKAWEASFSFIDERGISQSFQAKVKPRGRFRRVTCEFPPLKLKFSKDQLEAAGLSDMNELKLVTHCFDDKETSKNVLFKEYLAYKLYNELTPNSIRVQLVKINYLDKSNPDYRLTRYAFLMEDEEEFTARTGGKLIEAMGHTSEGLSPSHERIASLFQYMIGNTDWNVTVLRNVKLIEKEAGKMIPVPYDFDFAAIVAAPYARPNVDLGQKRISERVFMGAASSAKELYSTISYFKTKRKALLDMVNNFDLLDEASRLSIVEYLESFYAEIETVGTAQEAIFEKKIVENGTVFLKD